MSTPKLSPAAGRKILVTGASGYVGGRLVGQLLSEGFNVRVMVRNHNKMLGYPWVDRVEISDGDAVNYEETL